MKKSIGLRTIIIVVLLMPLFFDSCKDTWDDHYLQESADIKKTMIDNLEADSELSSFFGYLEETGYKSMLLNPEAFTVFAPVNNAFSGISQDTLNNPVLLKELIGNHICRYSYSTADAKDNIRLKMLNGKYEEFIETGTNFKFAESSLVEGDLLSKNGILHKINSVVRVKQNIWEYIDKSERFPLMRDYIKSFDYEVFDEVKSVPIGKNTLGQIVYDSVFVTSNNYFRIVGDLNSEEKQFTYLGLPDLTYYKVFDIFKYYYAFPNTDTIKNNVNKTVFNNLVFPVVSKNSLTGIPFTNTVGEEILINKNSVYEEVNLSNGYIFIMDDLTLDPSEIIHKPVRYEVENNERLHIGKTSDFTIKKIYDPSASGNFINEVSMTKAPASGYTNAYFDVSFPNVLSAKYDIYVRFAPIGTAKSTKLLYKLEYSSFDGKTTKIDLPGGVVSNSENGRIRIGNTYNFPVYINNQKNNPFFVKFHVIMDVSDAELVLYDRRVGIDYIELVPVQ